MERLLYLLERLQRLASRSMGRQQRPSIRKIEQPRMRIAEKAQHASNRHVGMPDTLAEPPLCRMPHAAHFQLAQRA